MGKIYDSFYRLGQVRVPTVAAVRGSAVGAGMNMLLAADLRILAALHGLRDENPAKLHAWLVRYRPAEQIRLFRDSWAAAGHKHAPRVSVSRSVLPIVDEEDIPALCERLDGLIVTGGGDINRATA